MRPSLVLLALACLPMTAQAQDASIWAGFNAGLQASIGDGSQEYSSGPYDLEGNGYGLFAGYLWATGSWAYGVELAYAKAEFYEVDVDTGRKYKECDFNDTLDLKARAGYAIDQALVYGVLGYGFSEWDQCAGPLSGLYDVEGVIVGAGVDYRLSDRFFVGGEILHRVMDLTIDPSTSFDADLTTVTLRAGIRF